MPEFVTKAIKVFKTVIPRLSMSEAFTVASLRAIKFVLFAVRTINVVRTPGSASVGVVEPYQKREVPSILLKGFVGINRTGQGRSMDENRTKNNGKDSQRLIISVFFDHLSLEFPVRRVFIINTWQKTKRII